MAISDVSGASDFDTEPPTYHWVFIAFIITFGFFTATWLIPLPGLFFINVLVSGTLLIIFLVLYGLEFNDNMEQYTFNLMYMLADKFGIDLNSIYTNAISLRDVTSLSDDSDTGLFDPNSSFMQILSGERSLFNADPIGYDDYATVKVVSSSS